MTTPGRNGGTLRRGGGNPKRNGGRPPNVIREGFRKNLPATERRMRARVTEIESLIERRKVLHGDDYAKLLDDQERLLSALKTLGEFQAKYGLGTTLTGTDTHGNNATPMTLHVVYEDDIDD